MLQEDVNIPLMLLTFVL